ncbi:unnamed protein product [Protopolystoma xenopodis]|uniref:adenosine kinase n=1 Tax=Protopolystoma xenopodis TaxID=117903 RepID=A0A448WEF1_9PLAT|nr:unnamed protein product [Protopolystoma xenopodis]
MEGWRNVKIVIGRPTDLLSGWLSCPSYSRYFDWRPADSVAATDRLLDRRLMAIYWREGVVFGLVNPLLDMVVPVDKAFLTKYHLKTDGFTLADHRYAGLFQYVEQHPLLNCMPGGSGQNTLTMLQWLLTGPPRVCTLAGCIGNDKAGDLLSSALSSLGVRTCYQRVPQADVPTGRCAVLVTETSRSLVTMAGATAHYTLDYLWTAEVEKCVAAADCFYVSVSHTLSQLTLSMLQLAHRARQTGQMFVVNLGAPLLIIAYHKLVDELLAYADVVIGNAAEACAYADECEGRGEKSDTNGAYKSIDDKTHINSGGQDKCGSDSHGDTSSRHDKATPHSAALLLAERLRRPGRQRIVLVTQGDQPILAVKTDQNGGVGQVREFPVEAVSPDQIADTCGCGDAFAAGFLAHYLPTKRTSASIRSGIQAAGYIIRRPGFSLGARTEFQFI